MRSRELQAGKRRSNPAAVPGWPDECDSSVLIGRRGRTDPAADRRRCDNCAQSDRHTPQTRPTPKLNTQHTDVKHPKRGWQQRHRPALHALRGRHGRMTAAHTDRTPRASRHSHTAQAISWMAHTYSSLAGRSRNGQTQQHCQKHASNDIFIIAHSICCDSSQSLESSPDIIHVDTIDNRTHGMPASAEACARARAAPTACTLLQP